MTSLSLGTGPPSARHRVLPAISRHWASRQITKLPYAIVVPRNKKRNNPLSKYGNVGFCGSRNLPPEPDNAPSMCVRLVQRTKIEV